MGTPIHLERPFIVKRGGCNFSAGGWQNCTDFSTHWNAHSSGTPFRERPAKNAQFFETQFFGIQFFDTKGFRKMQYKMALLVFGPIGTKMS